MKSTTASSLSLLLGAAGLVAADNIAGCGGGLAYADGGLYCRVTSSGSCTSDLGDFPAENIWPLHISLPDKAYDIEQIRLAKSLGNNQFTRYEDVLYIDPSPGAFKPVGFKPVDEVSSSEAISYWTTAYGFILWSATGDDVSRGFELQDVEGFPGLKQQYWNQDLYEQIRETGQAPPYRSGYWATSCTSPSSEPEIIDEAHP